MTDFYYLTHVADLSESEKIVLTESVFNIQNKKLVERKTPFSAKLNESLATHELQKPLNNQLLVVNHLKLDNILGRAVTLIKRTPYLQVLGKSLPQQELLLYDMSRIALSGILLSKLTVMQKRMPELYDHSIQVAIVAATIGYELGIDESLRAMLATAGLFHDLGELHINPALSIAKTKFTEEEWRLIYSHPLIAYEVLSRLPEIPEPIPLAILEHHERINGSGYPYATTGEKLSQLGCILAAAEMVTAICQREPASHVETVFKANVSGLSEQVEQALNRLLHRMQSHSTQSAASAESRDAVDMAFAKLVFLCKVVSSIMRSADRLTKKLGGGLNPLEREKLLLARIEQVRLALINAGLDPENCEDSMKPFMSDNIAIQEISSLLREICYQINSIVNETIRGWNFAAVNKSEATLSVERWLHGTQLTLTKLDHFKEKIESKETSKPA